MNLARGKSLSSSATRAVCTGDLMTSGMGWLEPRLCRYVTCMCRRRSAGRLRLHAADLGVFGHCEQAATDVALKAQAQLPTRIPTPVTEETAPPTLRRNPRNASVQACSSPGSASSKVKYLKNWRWERMSVMGMYGETPPASEAGVGVGQPAMVLVEQQLMAGGEKREHS